MIVMVPSLDFFPSNLIMDNTAPKITIAIGIANIKFMNTTNEK